MPHPLVGNPLQPDGMAEDFESAVRRHDDSIAATGLAIWVGSEPTFTDRGAQTPEWLTQALGGAKEQRAQAVMAALGQRLPGGLVMRCVGRQYPDEAQPRWSLGLLRRRDGAALWPQGPPDPLQAPAPAAPSPAAPDLDAWAAALAAAFEAQGFLVTPVATGDAPQRRLLLRCDAGTALPEAGDARLQRASVHQRPTPGGGLRDELAEAGLLLFTLGCPALDDLPTARLEWPLFGDLPRFLAALQAVAEAGRALGLPALVMAGYPPPVDATLEWTTVTPDPAVIEINTAPSLDGCDFLRRSRLIYAAAAACGLDGYRLYFNGAVADSGGGGQITLGGPTAQDSPFLRVPQLLPRLLRFFNHHPALSYLYSHDFVGSSGQSARADERGADAFDELGLALALLAREPAPSPQLLWHSLAPFLCDAAGNSHRAEINIEKLWNPFLAGRGKQGLVEFRALRMQHTPERATALACLLRAVVALLAGQDFNAPLVDWGRELHERYALPHYLEQDLHAVLAALQQAGLGLAPAIRAVLLRDEFRLWGRVALPGCRLEIRRALEFWPLLGDAASPEQGGASRLVDASTARLELRLCPDADSTAAGPELPDRPQPPDWRGWQLSVHGLALPLRHEPGPQGGLALVGLRYRRFVPTWGLHPALGSQAPLQLRLRHPDQPLDQRVTLHEWHPAGEAYAGLPDDLAEAARRRAERVTVAAVPREDAPTARPAPAQGLGPYGLDLRCLL